MPSERLAELIAQRSAATRELRELRAQRKTLTNACSRNARQWQVPADVIGIVLLCYTVSGFCLEPAVKYLAQYASCRKWPAKSKEELVAMVEQMFLTADMASLSDLVDSASTQYDSAARIAAQFVEEWRVAAWAIDLNSNCGVAPSSEDIIIRYNNAVQALAENRRPKLVGCMWEGSARMWAQRWRERWGASFGSIRAGETITAQELKARVL